MTGVTFTDISLEFSAKKASVELSQSRLNGLEIKTHPFGVGDCARHIPVTLGHRSLCGAFTSHTDFPVVSVVLTSTTEHYVVAIGDIKPLLRLLLPPPMTVHRTDQKLNRKTLLIVVWASLLLFTLFSGSIAG